MPRVAGIVLLSLLAAGCSSGSLSESSSSAPAARSSPDLTGRIADFFRTGGQPRPQRQAGQPAPPDEVNCPLVTVREGASTLTAHTSGQPSALSLRYQGTIGRVARECTVLANTLQMKVGVEGRIILGPAGGPGRIDVPLRFAVVREGPNPQTVTTKTYRVEVTIPPGDNNVPFVQIDEALTFPMPSAVGDLENYVVYVGYDPEALKKPAPRPRRPAPRRQS